MLLLHSTALCRVVVCGGDAGLRWNSLGGLGLAALSHPLRLDGLETHAGLLPTFHKGNRGCI